MESEEPRDDDRLLRLTIVIFSGALLVLILLSIMLSLLAVPSATLIYGSKHVWRGQQAGFRAIAVHPQRIRPLPFDAISLELVDEGTIHYEQTRSNNFLAEFEVPIPINLTDAAKLRITTTIQEHSETTEVALTPVDRPSPADGTFTHSRANTDRRPSAKAKGYSIHIYPESHHLTAGISNEVTGVLLHDGAPYQGLLTSDKLAFEGQTGAMGDFKFNITPHIKPKPIVFEVDDKPAIKTELPIRAQPTQLRLHTETGFFLEGRTELSYTVNTLPFKRPIHIDTWVGNTLVDLTTTMAIRGHHEGTLSLPTPAGVPLTVVAYRNIIVPDSNASWRTFWPGRGSESSDREAARTWIENRAGAELLKGAAFGPYQDSKTWLSLMASRYAPVITAAQLLHSTIDERRDAFDAYRVELRGHINRLFAATCFLGLILILTWVIRHKQQVRRAMESVALEHSAEDGDEDVLDADSIKRMTRTQNVSDMLLVLGGMLLFAYSMYILLARYLRWNYPV